MVYRRRAFRKKPAFRRRRPARRGLVRRVPRGIPQTYRFKRLAQLVRIYHQAGDAANVWKFDDTGNIILNAASASGSAWAADNLTGTYQNQFATRHTLSQLQSSADFTALYDRYKITGIKATFLYQISDAGTTGAGVLPTIMWAVDNDDFQVPTYPQLRQKQNIKQRILTANRPFSVFWRPKCMGALGSTNASLTQNALITRGYINAEYPNIDHTGIKMSLNNLYGSSAVSAQLEIKFTYYLSMKDPQ